MLASRQVVKRPECDRTRRRGSDAADPVRSAPALAKRVIVVGTSERARLLVSALHSSTHPKYEVVGYLTECGDEAPCDAPVLGSASEMFEIAERLGVDEVIVACVPTWIERLAEEISSNANGRPKIRLVPSVYDTMVCYPKLQRVHDLPLMTLNCDRRWPARIAKRIFDVVFSSFALVLTSPIMAAAVLLTRLTSRGPVLFRQARVGLNGQEFTLLKFRTMVTDAEKDTGPILSSPTDGRVTTVGRGLRKLKIDELPQFYNVLKGDMSVVGPRPERKCFVEQFSKTIPGYPARHQVRPGITGLAQVYGGYTTDPETKLKYDLMYAYGGSLLTDLKVLVLTFVVMVKGE